MKNFNNTKIIGIDHGYGNMKTANFCFPTGIIAYDSEPLFTADMLVYDGKYYLIGEGHKEFVPDKIKDEDYYILTLAAVAKELKAEGITEADVHIAAGLPLTALLQPVNYLRIKRSSYQYCRMTVIKCGSRHCRAHHTRAYNYNFHNLSSQSTIIILTIHLYKGRL